jgi:hypothetical protein
MRQKSVIILIIYGAIVLYCAKILIQASIVAPCDSIDAYFSILGWTMYIVGWLLFCGGVIAQGVKCIVALSDKSDE